MTFSAPPVGSIHSWQIAPTPGRVTPSTAWSQCTPVDVSSDPLVTDAAYDATITTAQSSSYCSLMGCARPLPLDPASVIVMRISPEVRERVRVIPVVVRLRRARTRFRRLPLVFHPVVMRRHLRSRRLMRSGGVSLHLGCGRQRKVGLINVDQLATSAVDYLGSVDKLPCRPGTVQRIENFHVIEHIPHPKVPGLLKYWHGLLQPGGQLIIECPHVDQAMEQYLAGDHNMLGSVYGWQQHPGDIHYFGYNPARLSELLTEAGFRNIIEEAPQDYHAKSEPCMRIEAIK